MKKKSNRVFAVLLTVFMLLPVLSAAVFAADDTGAAVGSEWSSYRGSDSNIAVTGAVTPRTGEEAALRFAYKLKEPDDWYTNISDPIMANGHIYIAVGSDLLVIDDTGNLLAATELEASIDYTCRPLFTGGMVVVPLSGGRLQAITADSLDTVWTTEALPAYQEGSFVLDHQSMTTLNQYDGYIYMGTACADWTRSYYGVYQCVAADTGDIVWQRENEGAGYYWSGGVVVNGALVIAGDDGVLLSLDAATGAETGRLELPGAVRSTVVRWESQVFFTTVDGILCRASVLEDGSLSHLESLRFAASSTGTPAVYDGKVYVGGALGAEAGYQGVLCVASADTMQLEQTVNAPAEVKSAPLIGAGYDGETHIYYTSNALPGSIYALGTGENGGESRSIFAPAGEDENYCIASIIADKNGTLYYTNDSGKLFAVAKLAPDEDENPSGVTSGEQGGDANVIAGRRDTENSGAINPKTGEDRKSASAMVLLAASLLSIIVFSLWRKRRPAQ